ncbi:MAG: DUF4190 domain-containing protein [Oscillospiraceae bacterium]|nr:DUF4190 domain-containing protein [Oscillospiraceae bacterium]
MDEFNKDPFNEEKPTQQPQQYQQPYQQNYNYNQQNINQQGYVPPQQGGYGYQQYTPYPQQPSQGMAVASLVLGIISIVFSLLTAMLPFLFLVPIIGIILGALHKSKHLPVGKGLSTAGIATSIIGIVLPILVYVACIALVAYFANEPGFMQEYMDLLKEMSPEDYEMLYEMYGEIYPEWFSEAVKFIFR